MARLALVGLVALLCAPARGAFALTLEFVAQFELVSASNPIDPRDWYNGSLSYDTDTHRLEYQVTQQLGYGTVGFSLQFIDLSGPIVLADPSGSTSTDWGSYWTITGAGTVTSAAAEASLLAGSWDLYTYSSYSTWKGNVLPVPEPATALAAVLALGLVLAARAAS